MWVDDPHFNVAYHVRHTALPDPGSEEQLMRMTGRVFSQALDRSRPLWEVWLVEGLSGGRFAVLSKTHHALVDGISGVDIMTVLFDTSPDPMPVAPPEQEWVPRPLPSRAQLLADAVLERATVPGEMLRGVARGASGAPGGGVPGRPLAGGAERAGHDGTPARSGDAVQRSHRTPSALHLGAG